MFPYTADIHLHPDGKRNGKSRHGERPKKLSTGIMESGIDVYALSEHHYVTEETAKVHSKIEGVMTGRKSKRDIVGFDGVELSASYKGLPFHIGYVFRDRLEEPQPGEFPDTGIDITGAEFQDWRALHPGIAVVNHPIVTHHEKQEDMRIDYTTAMLAEGIVDGCEVLNGAILLNGKNGSSVRRTVGAAQAFLRGRLHRATAAIIASSDAHWAKYRMPKGEKGNGKLITGPGCVRTRFTSDSPQDFLHAVQAGRTQAVVTEKSKILGVVEEVLQQCPEIGPFIRLRAERS